MDSFIKSILEQEHWQILKKDPRIPLPGTREASKGFHNFVIHADRNFQSRDKISIKVHPQGTHKTAISHYHEFYEIPIVYSGKFYHQLDSLLLLQDTEHLLLLPPGTMHTPWCADDDTIVFNLLVRTSCMEQDILPQLKEEMPVYSIIYNSLYDMDKNSEYLFVPLSDMAKNLLLNMIVEFFKGQEYAQNILVFQLLQLLFDISRKDPTVVRSAPVDKTSQILNYIQTHASDNCTLQQTADYFGYSVRHISRLLNTSTSQNFSEWVRDFKLEKACTLLKNTDLSVTDIVVKSGFSSEATFYNQFKKKYHMTAFQYRKSYLENRKEWFQTK